MSRTKFNSAFPITESSGKATQQFRDYLAAVDRGELLQLTNAANDAAAQAAGVPINTMYRNGSILMVRVT